MTKKSAISNYFKNLGTVQLVGLPFTISTMIILLSLQQIDPNDFPYDNARYAYSAIFQGYAAILALVLTAILVTFQNIHNQIYNVEERIYKILGIFSPYIPDSIEIIEDYSNREKLKDKILSFEPYEDQLDKLDGALTEIKHNFHFIDLLRRKSVLLTIYAKISIGLIVIVLLYSITALIIAVPTDPIQTTIENLSVNATSSSLNSTNKFEINPVIALQILILFVIMSLGVLTSFFLGIVSFWKTKNPKISFIQFFKS